MGKYVIKGGKKLEGEIYIPGGKNAVLPILASTILNGDVSIVHNCPKIVDVWTMIRILENLGCDVAWQGSTLRIDSSCATSFEVPEELVREMRSSIIFLGSILGRFKKVKISYPGGCELGPRPIDLHLKALKQLGAVISEEHGYIICEATELKGTRITLDFPSVGATENIMLAASMAKGRTTIYNPAKEPEIADLQEFLNAMGAKIVGAGSNVICIEGVEKLYPVEYRVMPDRIIAGTYLIAAAITGGEVLLGDVVPQHLCPVTSKLREAGCTIIEEANRVFIKAPKTLQAVDMIRTQPHPGFPTDMQPQLMTLLTVAQGTSIIIETVFESRYKHAQELKRMGANISLDGRTAIVQGVKGLMGAVVHAKDLRGGAALILAGLHAEGETVVNDSKHVERGYDSIENALRCLGADIQLIN